MNKSKNVVLALLEAEEIHSQIHVLLVISTLGH